MPKNLLLSDSSPVPMPGCEQCGGSVQVSRIEPMGEAGRFRRTYECVTCQAEFVVIDESDEEIQQFAERMVKTRKFL